MIVLALLASRQIERVRTQESIMRALIDVNREKDACLQAVLQAVHEEQQAHASEDFYWMAANEDADKPFWGKVH